MNAILAVLGVCVVIDGAASIYYYRRQSIPEHMVRVVRIAVGICVAYLGLTA